MTTAFGQISPVPAVVSGTCASPDDQTVNGSGRGAIPQSDLPAHDVADMRQTEPDALFAELSGAGLAAALEAVDVDTLPRHELVDLVAAWRRLASWVKARELALVNLLADRYITDDRYGQAWREWMESELSLGLTLTEWSASALVETAATLRDRLPGTMGLLVAGALDEPRVRVIVEGVKGLSEAACHRVETAILEPARSLTTAQLRKLVAATVDKVAADEAIARRKTSERSRRVEFRNDGQGTAEIFGLGLPAGPATAAYDRVDAIARAAKQAGDTRTTDQLRCDVFLALQLGLLAPGSCRIPDSALLADPCHEPKTDPQHDTDPAPGHDPDWWRDAVPGPVRDVDSGRRYDADGWRGASPGSVRDVDSGLGPDADGWRDAPGLGRDADPGGLGYDADPRCDTDTDPGCGGDFGRDAGGDLGRDVGGDLGRDAHGDLGRDADLGRCADGDFEHDTDLRRDTHHVLTHDIDHARDKQRDLEGDTGPGHIPDHDLGDQSGPGHGIDPARAHDPAQNPSLACAAVPQSTPGRRSTPSRQGQADSRNAGGLGEGGVPTPQGLLEAAARQFGGPHLVVGLDTLLGLAEKPGELGRYGSLVADIARQIADDGIRTGVKVCWTVTDQDGEALHHGETRYRPGPLLRKLVNARDRSCRFPHCGRPAFRCDLDHTLAHDQGGVTCPCNLAPLCRRHHRLKQAEGWGLIQPKPGLLVWSTPAGRFHVVHPETYDTG